MRAARAVPGMGRCGSVRSAQAPRNLLAAAGWLARSGCDADGCRALCQPGRPDRPCAARTGGDTCGLARHPGRGGAAGCRHRSQLAHAHRAIEFHPEPGVVQFGRDRPHAQSLWPQPQPGLCAGRLRRARRQHRCPALSAHGQSADRQPHPAGYRCRSGGCLFCLAGRACAGHRPDPAGNRPARQPRRSRRQVAGRAGLAGRPVACAGCAGRGRVGTPGGGTGSGQGRSRVETGCGHRPDANTGTGLAGRAAGSPGCHDPAGRSAAGGPAQSPRPASPAGCRDQRALRGRACTRGPLAEPVAGSQHRAHAVSGQRSLAVDDLQRRRECDDAAVRRRAAGRAGTRRHTRCRAPAGRCRGAAQPGCAGGGRCLLRCPPGSSPARRRGGAVRQCQRIGTGGRSALQDRRRQPARMADRPS